MRESTYLTDPSVPQAFLELLLRRRPTPEQVPAFPDTVTVLQGARPKSARLRAYRSLLGLSTTGGLPLLYPHVMAGRLHLAMMGQPGFPLSMLGSVHTHTQVRRYRALDPGLVGELRAWFGGAKPVRSGLAFDLRTDLVVDGEVLWSSRNTYQVRGRFGSPEDPGHPALSAPEPGRQTAQWRLPSDFGRAYARICGDWNPIHVSSPTARLFGFKRPIVHGYANLAMALGRVGEPDGPAALDAAFKGPVFLDNRAWAAVGDGGHFGVYAPQDPRPAIVGRLGDDPGEPLHDPR